MQYTFVLSVLFAFVAMFVSAVPKPETNASRMARGLGPLPPANLRRSMNPSRIEFAARQVPSSLPDVCPSGDYLVCCKKVDNIFGDMVGSSCTTLSDSGFRSGTCHTNAECCKNVISSTVYGGCQTA